MAGKNNKLEQSLTETLDQTFPVLVTSDAKPDFVIEAYPRSGNTFLAVALRTSWPRLNVLSHSHDPNYVNKTDGSIPVVTLARSPLEAIASTAVHLSTYLGRFKESKDLHSLIGKYGVILAAALKNPNVLVISFDTLTSDVNQVLDFLEQQYGLGEREVRKTNEELLAATYKVSTRSFGTEDTFLKRGNVPREKHAMYYEVLEALSTAEYATKISELNRMYESAIAPHYSENK